MNETTNESTPALHAALPQNRSDMTFEPSPWLQRQLSGPVQWRAFGTAALAEARALDRPLLLVVASEDCLPFEQMAAESFADPATAAVLNEGYVCCLADARWHRELDRQLQLVHQLLVGRAGGWPLLALIDPADARPCFAGTYFPASPTPPLPGFADFLRQALGHFQRQRAPLQAQGERLAKAFAQLAPPPLPPGMELVSRPLELARQQLETRFDRETGAFTRGQPVASAAAAQCLLRHWAQRAATPQPDLHALFIATLALTRTGASISAASSHAAELTAFAAAAAATGEPDFRLAAEHRYAALAVQASTALAEQANTAMAELGTHTATALPAVENWHRLRAMALAARWLDRPDWAETTLAQHAAASWTTTGTLGDNAAALAATLALLELRWSASGFQHACELATSLCAQLGTAAPSPLPGLPPVPEQADDTLPSAEGMAAVALYRFGCLCGEANWQAAAADILRRAWRPMNEAATTHLTLLEALEEQTLGLQTIVIRGTPAEAERWARALGRWYAPARQVFAIPAAAAGLPPRLAALETGNANGHTPANGNPEETPDKNADVDANQNAVAWIFAGDAQPVQSDSLEQLTRELRDRLHRD